MKQQLITGLTALILTAGCGRDQTQEAIQVGQSQGWTNVKVIEIDYFLTFPNCILKGDAAYHISGTAPNGKQKTGTVCCGYTNLTSCGSIKY